MTQDKALSSAEFDKRVIDYFWLQAMFLCVITFIGIPLVPVWFLFDKSWHRRQYENLSCELTPRSLNLRSGVLIKVQKNIPLDKITDLAVNEGPLLRYFGLCSLMIETAGSAQGSTGHLFGVVEPLAFRDKVLAQRDLVMDAGSAPASAPSANGQINDGVLVEIRDTLQRIEKSLAERS